MPNQHETILLGHGSRNPDWASTLEQGLASIQGKLATDTYLAHMELAEPSLETIIHQRIAAGVESFSIIPLFFASGKHLKVDIPQQIQALQAQYPACKIDLQEALGDNPAFWQFIAKLIDAQNQA